MWAVMAIRIQREVGGNLAELLDTVADTMTQRERLRLEIRALTAEGRFSGWILGIFPVAFAGILYLIQPDYMGVLFYETIGIMAVIACGDHDRSSASSGSARSCRSRCDMTPLMIALVIAAAVGALVVRGRVDVDREGRRPRVAAPARGLPDPGRARPGDAGADQRARRRAAARGSHRHGHAVHAGRATARRSRRSWCTRATRRTSTSTRSW